MLIHTLFSISCQIKALCQTVNATSVLHPCLVEIQGIFSKVCLHGADEVLFSHEAP